ncbi:hypothetical protein JOC85_002010 [Bacillus mesophilus]|uniref:ABC transporter periplasmic binding protein yphF n=1 Tax=Bacillus mesophilus TaxID=1808955 RepID=A0A6M0Q4C1_9BACI|nr:hypothetical protein [Bacillus mesophilus]MBM7661238.1 hypothetical protein [Bacillus mesophilus]NEY71237.1 hypothetical protein [Bacillus mesophilus]
MKKYTLLLIICSFLLSGCLYPDDRLAQNSIPYTDQLQSVQTAVNQFREDSGGLLPIKDRDMETPIYQKYPVDFSKVVPRYLAEPPSSAYESGGIYQYVLVDVEENPTVKLIDLRLADGIRELKTRIQAYKRTNGGYPPFDKILTDHIFTVDYEKLGYEEPPFVVSPYSGENLPFIINNEGEIFIDYSLDLYRLLQETDHKFQPGDDIRPILLDHAVFVPAFSVPYTVENNEPVFLQD